MTPTLTVSTAGAVIVTVAAPPGAAKPVAPLHTSQLPPPSRTSKFQDASSGKSTTIGKEIHHGRET